jgi:hypothetical protein
LLTGYLLDSSVCQQVILLTQKQRDFRAVFEKRKDEGLALGG